MPLIFWGEMKSHPQHVLILLSIFKTANLIFLLRSYVDQSGKFIYEACNCPPHFSLLTDKNLNEKVTKDAGPCFSWQRDS